MLLRSQKHKKFKHRGEKLRHARKIWHEEKQDNSVDNFLKALKRNGLCIAKATLYAFEREDRRRMESIDDIHIFAKTVDISARFFTRQNQVSTKARFNSVTKTLIQSKDCEEKMKECSNPIDTGFFNTLAH